MSKINPRERQLLTITVSLGFLAFLQIGMIRPILSNVRRLNTKVKVSVRELRQMRDVVACKKSIEDAYESIRNRITSRKNQENEIIDMLLTVERAARDSGVEILENQHVKDTPSEYFNLHMVNFHGRGEPNQIMRMIYTLQNPQLLLKIPEIDFSIKDYKMEVQLQVTRVVYSVKKNEQTVEN